MERPPAPLLAAGSEMGTGGRGPRRKGAARSVLGKAADGDEQDGQGDDDEDDEGRLFHGSVGADAEPFAEPEQGRGQVAPEGGDDGARDG